MLIPKLNNFMLYRVNFKWTLNIINLGLFGLFGLYWPFWLKS